MIEMG